MPEPATVGITEVAPIPHDLAKIMAHIPTPDQQS